MAGMISKRRWGAMPKENGFTFIELAVIIIIVGVLAVTIMPLAIEELNISKMREVNSQLIADIEELRSASIRTSRSTSLELINVGGKSGYKMIFDKNDPSRDIIRNFPKGMVIEGTESRIPSSNFSVDPLTGGFIPGMVGKSSVTKIGFYAPYGTITATGVEIMLYSNRSDNHYRDGHRIINYLIGVTGKPIAGNLERKSQRGRP